MAPVENAPPHKASGQVADDQEPGSRRAVSPTTGLFPDSLKEEAAYGACGQAGWGHGWEEIEKCEDCLVLPARPPDEGFIQALLTVHRPSC